MDSQITRIINKALDGNVLDEKEIVALLSVERLSEEAFAIQQAGRTFTSALCDGKAEIHCHVGLDASPCPSDCQFCSFAASAKIFTKPFRLPLEKVLEEVRTFEEAGVNAIYLVTTVRYGEEDFLETAKAVKKSLTKDIPVIANIPDFDSDYAKELKNIGIEGVYHVIRLGEGVYTRCKVDVRLNTIKAAQDAGLVVGNCIEPIGPEHTPEELTEKILLARELGVGFSGAMRRNTLPDTVFSQYGNIPYSRLATTAGAIALATGPDIRGNCTHEPSQLCAQAGCNIMWAERGTSPRDTEAETRRGLSVEDVRNIYFESEWDMHDGPSRFYRGF